MADDIKATVIILTYRQADTVGRAIESVLGQRCDFTYEVLVADDGSDDGTRQICEGYARQYPDKVRLMPLSANKGIVDNYFDAVLEAKGEYVADCAGDDEWIGEERLAHSVRLLDDNNDVTAVFTDVEVKDMAGSQGVVNLMPHSEVLKRGEILNRAADSHSVTDSGARAQLRLKGDAILRDLFNHTDRLPYVLSSAVYRRAAVVPILQHHPELLRCHDGRVEDIPLIAALAEAGDALYLPIRGYRYYIDGESASNNLTHAKDYRFVAGVTDMMHRLASHYGFGAEDMRRFYKAKINYMASQARHAADPDLGRDLRERCRRWGMRVPLRGRVHLWLLAHRKSR